MSFNTGTRTTGISPANPSKSGQTDLNTGASLTSNNPASMTQSSQYLKGTQNQDGVRRCYFCGSPDHLISNCTDKKSKEGKNRPAKTNEENPFSHTTALLLLFFLFVFLLFFFLFFSFFFLFFCPLHLPLRTPYFFTCRVFLFSIFATFYRFLYTYEDVYT